MELYTLDSNFQPKDLIENYESLIWSERYSALGDFEIKSSNISELVNALPRESCVCLRDSSVPMIIETHKLTKPLREKPSITIFGRSLESVLERRGSVNSLPTNLPRTPWNIEAAKESDAAYLAMRIVLGDVARTQGGVTVLPVTTPVLSALDAIPELNLTLPADYLDVYNTPAWVTGTSYNVGDKVRHSGYIWSAQIQIGPGFANPAVEPTDGDPTRWLNLSPWTSYEIKPQNLYATVNELINTNHRGMKAVRPLVGGIKFNVEIYNGANLSEEQVIDAKFDQIDDATYLLSTQGSTNVGYVYDDGGSQIVLKNTAPEPSGLARRVLVLDSSGEDLGDAPSDARKNRGLIELYKYNATALFDGQVAEQIAAGYNKDYFLGDILKLVGEYGLEQKVRVSEFIRTSDATGEKSYPTFEAVDE